VMSVALNIQATNVKNCNYQPDTRYRQCTILQCRPNHCYIFTPYCFRTTAAIWRNYSASLLFFMRSNSNRITQGRIKLPQAANNCYWYICTLHEI